MLTVTNSATFDWAGQSLHDCAKGNAMDSWFTLKLLHLYNEKMEDLEVGKVNREIISPLIPIFAQMEYDGLDVSMDNLKSVGGKLAKKNVAMHDEMYKHPAVKKTDNVASNDDQIRILFTRDDGFELYPPGHTDGGAPSVAKEHLDTLINQIEEELEKRKK